MSGSPILSCLPAFTSSKVLEIVKRREHILGKKSWAFLSTPAHFFPGEEELGELWVQKDGSYPSFVSSFFLAPSPFIWWLSEEGSVSKERKAWIVHTNKDKSFKIRDEAERRPLLSKTDLDVAHCCLHQPNFTSDKTYSVLWVPFVSLLQYFSLAQNSQVPGKGNINDYMYMCDHQPFLLPGGRNCSLSHWIWTSLVICFDQKWQLAEEKMGDSKPNLKMPHNFWFCSEGNSPCSEFIPSRERGQVERDLDGWNTARKERPHGN